MSEHEVSSDQILDEYDDGVVCFGPVLTESQLDRLKRLPRRTVVPSDIKLSQSFDSNGGKNEDNDQSTLNNTIKNATAHITKDSVNITYTTNNIVEDESCEIEFCKDDSSIFSSPCASEIIPKGKLMDTEVLKRYIRKESISSSDETFSEDHNNSTFKAEVSYIDGQEAELSEINSVCNNTGASSCKQMSVPSVTEQNISDDQNISPDIALNICMLKPFGQEEDNDLSYCSDSVLEDNCDDSIVSDKYYITPGKQRIFDMRLINPSIRSKTLIPSMDRIEENSTPVMPNVLNYPLMTNNDDSCLPSVAEDKPSVAEDKPSVAEDNLNGSDTGMIINLSTVNLNHTSEREFESTKVIVETQNNSTRDLVKCNAMETFSIYHTVSDEVLKNDTSVLKESTFSNHELLDTPSKSINKNLNDLNTVVNKVALDDTINIKPVIISETNNVNGNNEIAIKVKKYSNDSRVMNTTYGDACINTLFTNSYNESLNETNLTKDLSNDIKLCDEEKSLGIMSNTTINKTSQPDESNFNNSLKDLTKLDNSYLDTTEHTYSNAVPNVLESISQNMRQYSDFKSVTSISTNSSTCDTEMNASENNDLTQENKLECKLKSNVSFNNPVEDIKSSITDTSPIKSNLSVIIENRTLEESSCNDVELNNEVLNTSSNLTKKDNFTTKNSSISEIQTSIANETDNSNLIEMETKSNGDILINNLILDDYKIHGQKNVTEFSNFAIVEFDPEIRSPNQEEHIELKTVQQPSLLNLSENSLENYSGIDNLFNFPTEKKTQQFEYNTPKIQKLLDFSILQQTPTDENQSKKQKLFNFSIVEQTPISKSILQTSLNKTLNIKDTLIDFSAVDQLQEFGSVSANKDILLKNLESPINDEFLNNLSTVSAPDIEFFMDESMKTNLSNQSNMTMINTVNDTDINLSSYSDKVHKPNQMNTDQSRKELKDLESIDDNNCSMKNYEHSDSLDKTVESSEYLELSSTTEKMKPKTNYLPITIKQNIENLNSSESNIACSNQQLVLNSNECVIVDFSIIEQSMLQESDSNINKNVESDGNITNFIDMSMADIKSNGQVFLSSQNSVIDVTSGNETENSMNSNSDDINKTTIHLEEFKCHNDTLLTDIQMDDVSLLRESPRKSLIDESFHSIEFDNVDEDNKRKMPVQEFCSIEKKMKVENEELKTPISMLYKIKSMFRSSEKPAKYASNTKASDLKSDKYCHALNNLENKYNFAKPASLRKCEPLTKSKIPCIVTDKSVINNDEFNSSSLLNDSIKPKRVIPKFTGVPVLSDVSNSSSRKCPESRIPSKLNK